MAGERFSIIKNPAGSVARPGGFVPQAQASQVLRNYRAPFYDTLAFPAQSSNAVPTGKLVFFSAGQGAGTTSPTFNNTAGSVKDYVDTNLQTSGGIFPSGQAYLAEAIGVAILPTITATVNLPATTATTLYQQFGPDMQAMAQANYLESRGGTTAVVLGTALQYPAGYGITGSGGGISTANGVTQYGFVWNNGFPSAAARNRFSDFMVAFNSDQAFLINLIQPRNTAQIGAETFLAQICWWGTFTDQLGG